MKWKLSATPGNLDPPNRRCCPGLSGLSGCSGSSARSIPLAPACERDRPGDDPGEREGAQHAQRAGRQSLAKNRHSGRNRESVRQESGDASRRQRRSALEAELKGDEGESVAAEDGRDEGERGSAGDGSLRGYVSARVEDAGGDSKARAWCKPALQWPRGKRCNDERQYDGLRLVQFADAASEHGGLPPFIAVIPPAGLDVRDGDWTGVWESYLVDRVVPWVDAHFPTIAAIGGRTLAGLSAGGYGAVDIGLRHARLFGTLESWSGYFTPLRTGVLRHADAQALAGHNPTLLVRREAPLLRRLGTHFFISSGTTHDRDDARAARAFAAELELLGVRHRLWLGPGGHDGRLWRAQLPEALRYAFTG
jgi:hypothetical protein